MRFAYAGALLVSLAGMVVLDLRHRLFFAADARRAAVVVVSGVVTLVAWDLVGIHLGLFLRGDSPYMTGWLVAPELPVEELGFLTLLCYLTMNLYAAFGRVRGGRVPGSRDPGGPARVGGAAGLGRST
jgi:lycopene cyclase domain-containing protein